MSTSWWEGIGAEWTGQSERSGRATLEAPTDRFDVLLDVFRPCLRRAWLPRVLAGRMHLFAEDLRPHAPRQLGQFDGLEAAEAATALKRAVNDRHGRFALRSAAAGADAGDEGPPSAGPRRAASLGYSGPPARGVPSAP
jgi:hypothetical protein